MNTSRPSSISAFRVCDALSHTEPSCNSYDSTMKRKISIPEAATIKIIPRVCWSMLLIPACMAGYCQHPGPSTFNPSGQWTTWTSEDGLPENDVRVVVEDGRGQLWFGTRNKGIGVFDGSSWTYYRTEDGLGSDGVLSIVEGPDGRIWAGGGGGYSIFNGDSWISHDSLGAIQPRVVFSIRKDYRGNLWFSANGGASELELAAERWQNYTTADGLPHRVVHTAVRDRSNNIWFACRQGLAQLVDGSIRVHYPEDNFGSILEDGEGHAWFGTRTNGAYRFDGKNWDQYSPGQDVRPRIIDQEGRIWAISETAGVYIYDGDTWTQLGTADGLVSETVFDVHQTRDGSLWFATDQGVSRYTRP